MWSICTGKQDFLEYYHCVISDILLCSLSLLQGQTPFDVADEGLVEHLEMLQKKQTVVSFWRSFSTSPITFSHTRVFPKTYGANRCRKLRPSYFFSYSFAIFNHSSIFNSQKSRLDDCSKEVSSVMACRIMGTGKEFMFIFGIVIILQLLCWLAGSLASNSSVPNE